MRDWCIHLPAEKIKSRFIMSRIVLLGLPDDLAAPLRGLLTDESHEVAIAHTLEAVRRDNPEVAFVSGDGPEFPHNVSWLLESMPRLPVVVVTRLPDSQRWLDALEAGARDYCGAPFEHTQLRWILDTVCPPAARRAA
jgi:DNA-binding NtrC family response regulator